MEGAQIFARTALTRRYYWNFKLLRPQGQIIDVECKKSH